MASSKDILVYGAGAVGSLLGGFLARAGHRVVLLGRPQRMQAIREYGLKIDGIWGTHHVSHGLEAVVEPESVADRRFDYILVTVKAYDTPVVARALEAAPFAFGVVASVQNGYGNVEALAERLGRDQVLGARIITGVVTISAAHVRVTVSADAIRIGPPFEDVETTWPAAVELARILDEAGIRAEATRQYREYLWDKILYNAALNPLGALLHATYGELAQQPGIRNVMDRVIQEAYAVMEAHAIPHFLATADEYLTKFYEQLIPRTADHYPSMLDDLKQRGRTEIDALNGAIARLGAEAGVPTPVNDMLTAMVHLREQTRQAELRR